MLNIPNDAATGIDPRTTARPRSVTMRIGLRRRRSTRSPAPSPKTRDARLPIPASRPIWNGFAFKTNTATSGRATSVTRDPISDIVWPIHSFRKSELCQRLVGRKCMPNRVAHPLRNAQIVPELPSRREQRFLVYFETLQRYRLPSRGTYVGGAPVISATEDVTCAGWPIAAAQASTNIFTAGI